MQLQKKNWTLTPARAGEDTTFAEASQFLTFPAAERENERACQDPMISCLYLDPSQWMSPYTLF